MDCDSERFVMKNGGTDLWRFAAMKLATASSEIFISSTVKQVASALKHIHCLGIFIVTSSPYKFSLMSVAIMSRAKDFDLNRFDSNAEFDQNRDFEAFEQ